MLAQLSLPKHGMGLFGAATKRPALTHSSKSAIVIGLLAAALIGLIVADTATTIESARSPTVTGTAAPAQDVGVFTGTYVDGMPVYRLAPIEVTAVRDASAPR